LSLGIDFSLFDVFIGKSSSFSNSFIKERIGDGEGIVSPDLWVEGSEVRGGSWVGLDEIISIGTDFVPVGIRERSVKVISLSVDD